jgi:aspartate 1-decarboxylase
LSTIQFVRSKIHRAVVTGGDVNYPGSIVVGLDLMEAAQILPYELVHINNIDTAVHWETYVIPGKAGDIILNGAPARLFAKGDRVVILAMVDLDPSRETFELFEHRIVYVHKDGIDNTHFEIAIEKIDAKWYEHSQF